MKKFQKNQIIIYVIALMLVTAGYLNYVDRNVTEVSSTGQNQTENIGEATLVSNNETVNNTVSNNTSTNGQNSTLSNNASTNGENNTVSENESSNDEISYASSITQEEFLEDEEELQTNSQVSQDSTNDDYFVNSKLEREKMYSQMLETYQNMLNNTNISEEQKSIATQEITKINNTKNSIMICENLILNKNFENVVIFVNTDSINVVIQSKELKQEEVAQVQNIITRELSCSIDQIHIMTKN